ncbi:DNA gyrase inhibitor YacG [Hansschlegelia quercus]|uniref:DNA gyrase inhibitor YacG n=1 Tax=Hansschlegelia quercus TaxID=2528245 RepID=A0A4Q9GQP7_9HYPH|nr:DNA gyrase inhibitor YacG [Hansschlegelia quercus]TBN54017.1 DNA gyrase inhibitor YacG [Hansschlegelia quercus]
MGAVNDPEAKPCAICGRPMVEKYRPFCSKRCADVDLSRWFSGVYAVPAEAQDEDDKDQPEPPRGN